MTLTFRKAGLADIEAVAAILSAAVDYKLAHNDLAWGREPYTPDEASLRVKNGHTYVACDGDEIIGTFIFIWDDQDMWGPQPPIASYIHGLAVKAKYHGQHIGEQIIGWCAEQTRLAGRQFVRLDCAADNAKLCAYYEDLGFNRVATKQNPIYPDWTTAYFERNT